MMNNSRKNIAKAVSVALCTFPLIFTANVNAADDTHTYKFGGFIKTTGTFSDYSAGDLASGSIGRDFYIPATIPVGGTSESNDFDFSAKETRLNFKSTHKLANGIAAKTYVEMDFLASPGGNERVSNSYNPRLRHAFVNYGNWTIGQTWSTFQDVKALPEAVDFLAASDGIIFERQPLIKYTSGPFQIALENPESTITPNGGSSTTGGTVVNTPTGTTTIGATTTTRIVSDDNSAPDVVARYNHKANWGHVSVAGLLRKLSLETGTTNTSTTAGGVSVTGKFKVGVADDIRFNLASGSGLGRYAGLNTANGGVISASGELVPIDSTLGAISYRHLWNPKWRSNFILSGISVDNSPATGATATKSVKTFQVNLLHNPTPKLTLGVGFLTAERELENGNSGDLDRLIFSAKYAF